MSPTPPLRIGTRQSLLARTQSGHVQAAIARLLGAPDHPEVMAPLVFITTTGDRIQDRRLMDIGGKALFTKEIEKALFDGWMIASSPALSALDHPRYDVWVLRCSST